MKTDRPPHILDHSESHTARNRTIHSTECALMHTHPCMSSSTHRRYVPISLIYYKPIRHYISTVETLKTEYRCVFRVVLFPRQYNNYIYEKISLNALCTPTIHGGRSSLVTRSCHFLSTNGNWLPTFTVAQLRNDTYKTAT